MSLVLSAGAAAWSQVLRVTVTLGTYVVLRRYIAPSELGVWNWAEAIFLLIGQVRDLGLPAEIARRHNPKYGNYLLVLLVWSTVLALSILLAAPLLAMAFREHGPETVRVLRFMCIFLVVQGLGVLPTTFLDVEMLTIRTVPPELARNAFFAVTSIYLAVQGYGVWSIIYAHVGAATLYTLGVWYAARRNLRLETETSEVPGFVWAGLPLMVLSFMELGVVSVEVLVLGRRFPEEVVGFAGLALLATFFLGRQIADACGRPLYPAMLHAGAPDKAFSLYRSATVLFAGLIAPAAFGVYLNAELIVEILGGERWRGAVPYMHWFAFVPLLRPLSLFGRELLLILKRDRLLLVYSAASFLGIGGLGLLFTRTSLGPFGMAVASFFPVGQLVLMSGLHDVNAQALRELLREIAIVYVVNVLVFAPLVFARDHLGIYTRFAVSLVLALLAVAWIVRLHKNKLTLLLGVAKPH